MIVIPMGAKTAIQWSDATWSPLRVRVRSNAADIARAKNYTSLIQIGEKMAGRVGQHCEHISDGCLKCYSGTWQGRCLTSGGTGLPFDRRSRDLVEPFVDEKSLADPLRWKTPKKIFVENQSDLFGEWYTDEMIDRVFAVMALCPQHVFQVLTKRPERMQAYLSMPDQRYRLSVIASTLGREYYRSKDASKWHYHNWQDPAMRWPLPNIWLGVSVEDQKTADARTHYLRQIPAAVRFISQEPQLSRIEWTNDMLHGISWLICGGESGPGARPFDIAWVRDTIKQCSAANVACFIKQLGANPVRLCNSCKPSFHGYCRLFGASLRKDGFEGHGQDGLLPIVLGDRKGGAIEEWPLDLRVRQFPGEQPIIPAAEHRSDEWHEPEVEC